MLQRIITCTLLFLLMFGSMTVFASVSVPLDNYHYVHTNQPGSYSLKDKYGNVTIYGDAVENDATIKRVLIQQQGKTAGDKVYVNFEGGGRQEITTFGSYVTLSNQNSKSISISLEKSGTNEVWISLKNMDTYDQTGGGTDLTYSYNRTTPTQYGSLGDSGGGGGGSCTVTATLNDSLLAWSVSNATNFYQVQIKKDGNHFGYMGGTTGQVDLRSIGQGTYTVSAIDMDKNILCTSNQVYYAGDPPGGDPGGGDPGGDPGGGDPGGEDPPPEEGGGCNGCDWLAELLTCPFYEVYLGDLTDAISRAIPPPPDWNYVSGIFADRIAPAVAQQILNISPVMADIFAERWGDEFEQRMGYAPDLPYYEYPGNDPFVSTRIEDVEKLQPQNPYNQPLDFNLSDREEIEIKDESKPFVLTDPLAVIGADEPGKKVMPGDPENDTGGIEIPKPIESETPLPTNTAPSVPTDPAPIPSPADPEEPPTPNQPPGEQPIPIPDTDDPPPEKKYYKEHPEGG